MESEARSDRFQILPLGVCSLNAIIAITYGTKKTMKINKGERIRNTRDNRFLEHFANDKLIPKEHVLLEILLFMAVLLVINLKK